MGGRLRYARFRQAQELFWSPMPDAELTQEVIDVSTRLIDASREGEIDGKDVAAELDKSDIDLYWAFQEAKRQGALKMYFPGGMELPSMIRRL